jgi:hypothetical protein
MSEMTRADRTELARVVRMRSKVARNGIEARQAELLVEFETQLAADYEFDDARWAAVTAAAKRAVAEADAEVAAACEELAIPSDFRPRLGLEWYGRGKNASARRRAELRKVALTRLDAAAKVARAAIDQSELDACTDLAAGALQSEEARAWLGRLPTVEQLMVPLHLADVEAARSLGQGQLTATERHALPRWDGPSLTPDAGGAQDER